VGRIDVYVKTIYRTSVFGVPTVIDENYRDDLELLEERIITLKARNFDEAILKGEKEATKYAVETKYLNPYGQKVRQKYIGSIDAFELFDDFEANVEVYSTTFIIESSLTNSQVTNNLMGNVYKNDRKIRTIFFNSEFSGIFKKC